MGFFENIKNRWRLFRASRFLLATGRTSTKKEYEIGKQLYKLLYEEMVRDDKAIGNIRAVSSVVFTCPYPGHISLVKNVLDGRIGDADDPTRFSKVSELEDNSYVLSVGVSSGGLDDAILIADASCMSALLQVNTIEGELQRVVAAADKEDEILSFDELCTMTIEELSVA